MALSVCSAILPLFGGIISIWFSLKLIIKVLSNAYFRSRIYQRLMAACAFTIIIQSVGMIWGPFAVPAGTQGFPFASGTVATCSARGVLDFQAIVVPMYFMTIYILACIAVRNKTQIKLHPCIEVGMHFAFYGFSLGSSIYLLTLDAFNPIVRGCGLASIPLGCGDNSEDKVECTRGPQNISYLQWYFVGLPALITVLLPTLMMLVMYCWLRGEEVVKSVCKQSALFFLAGIYWTFFFSVLDYVLMIVNGGEVSAAMNILANTIRSLQGVWVYMTYIYFRSKEPTSQEGVAQDKPRSRGSSTHHSSTSFGHSAPLTIAKPDFSIFDGTDVGKSGSPWAKFLIDEGEDESYQQGYEYEDTDYGVQDKLPREDLEIQVPNSLGETVKTTATVSSGESMANTRR